ncbi:PAS domain S-box-containing protein [Candidatus Thermokryptus mobilis]|uniref:histidine kinase n=1 Tax=Candidatus Thermokryptus mobilis TaxID=1643428 RepID=A0A0S4MRD1_9BACT|nr:PAS domain S-box protein [Candidatus Thermokryptus mobilis]CUU01644.1 PAS domain S-box-containing protein [Candidatus Thermokryptus mobilis]
MNLKIDPGIKETSNVQSFSLKTALLYSILTALIINFAVFLNQWFYGGEIELDLFIIPSAVGAIFGIIFSMLRLAVERKIAEAKRFWEGVFQSAINGIILTDLTGKIKYANDYAINYHEYTLEELKEFYIFDLVTPEFIEIVREYIKDLIERNETEALEIGFLTKSGKVKYAELSGRLVKHGSSELIQFVEIDTTEKRRFENELIEAEKKYRELFENAVIGVYRTTPDGKIIDVNPAFVKMFGAKDKFEILRMKASDLYADPRDREIFIRALEISDSISNFENRLKRLDGKEIIVREHVRAVKDSLGNVIFYDGMIEDITEQRKAEEKLKESEEKYRTLVEGSLAGTYIFQDGKFKFVSGQILSIFGFTPQEVLNTRRILEIVHPEDRKKVIKLFTSNLKGDISKSGSQFRIIKKNGEIAWVEVLNNLINYEGKPALLGTMLDITDRIKAEQRNRIMSQLLLSLNDAVVLTDENGNILEVNDAFCRVTGYSKDEVIGKNPRILKSGLHDANFYKEMWESILTKGYWRGEIINKKKNGEFYFALLSISSIKDEIHGLTYYLGIQSDITERKKAEEQIRYQANLLENVNDAIIAADLNYRITSWNKAAEKMYGYKAEEVIGKEISEVVKVEFPDLTREQVRQILQEKGFWKGEAIHYNRFGEKIYVSSSLSIIRDINGNPIGTVGINRDITEQKKAEEKLKLYAEQLELANAQLQELNKLKSEFLANTSHELRTPLNSIIGFLNLIKEGLYESKEEMMQFVDNALMSARHLLNIINDILDIAKIEAGKLELTIEDVEVSELLQEVWTLSHVQAEQKKLEYRVIYPEKPIFIRGDRNRLKQILLNLIGNAIKFTHKGGITVKAEVFEEKGHCQFSVIDTGIGISKEKQAKLFQKFVQADGTTTRKYGGTGLGLAITKSLVEIMGGVIELFSEGEGKGTTVTFTIPLSTKSFDKEITIKQGEIYGDSGLLILAVDDDPGFAEFLKTFLVKNSFRFLWVDNADDGWDYILKFKPDVLILDYAIPHKSSAKLKNGFDIVLRIYDTPELKDMPIIIVTGHLQKVNELLKLSFINFKPSVVEKPIEPEHLLKILKQFVKEKNEIDILLADDDPNIEIFLRKILPHKFKIDYAKNGKEAIEKIKSKNYDILLLDLMMPELNGYDVIRELRIKKLAPELPILVITNYPEPTTQEEKELLSKSMGIIVVDKSELNSQPEKLISLINKSIKTNQRIV